MKQVILYADDPGCPGLTAIRKQVEAAGKRLVVKPLRMLRKSAFKKS